MTQHRHGVLHVLDRLEEDDRVELPGLAVGLHQPSGKGQIGPAV